MLSEDGGHFGRLNAVTADFHLVVYSSGDTEQAHVVIAATIASAIDDILRVIAKRIGNEAVSVSGSRIEVTTCAKRSANDNFARFAYSAQLICPIDDECLSIRKRLTNRLDPRGRLGRDRISTFGKSCFRRTVEVKDYLRAKLGPPTS